MDNVSSSLTILTKFGMNKEEQEGNYAYYDGCDLADNPYDMGTDQFNSWATGWKIAQEHAESGDEMAREWGV